MRRLVLRSPLFSQWRTWAGRTATDGLEAFFPGEGKDATLLKSYLAGL